MKKILSLFCLSLLPFMAEAESYSLEFKASYYHFSSKHVHRIIGDGAGFYQGEINFPICDFILFADGGYISKKGRSLGFCQKTRFEAVPFTVGLKYKHCLNMGDVYVGGGVRTFIVQMHDHSDTVQRFVKKTSVGGVINVGLNYRCWGFVINPFFEYNFNRMSFHRNREDVARNIYRHKLDLSGYNIGAGIGYEF